VPLERLDSPRSTRPGQVNSYFRQRVFSSTPPPRSPTFAELVEQGVPPSPWCEGHPSGLYKKKQISLAEKVAASERERLTLKRQRTEQQFERRREEQRRVDRELDGSRSSTPSPGISRIGSFKRADTGSSSINSGSSANSSASSRVSSFYRNNIYPVISSNSSRHSSFLSRIHSAPAVDHDRKLEGHEARKEQQLRRPDTGTDSKPDIASYGGQGQRRLLGKYTRPRSV
jgi:hypothetical protein